MIYIIITLLFGMSRVDFLMPNLYFSRQLEIEKDIESMNSSRVFKILMPLPEF